MKKFTDFIFSRQMLAFLLIVLLVAAIWFLGPLFAFGGMRPLATVGMRITVLILTLALILTLFLKKPLHIIGVACLCLLIWHAGPLLAIGSMQPLVTVFERSVVIAIILFIYAVYGLYHLYQMMRTDENLRDTLFRLKTDNQTQAGKDAKEALKSVNSKIGRAMLQLKAMRSNGGSWRRLVEGKRYLYELPWYMIIGNPGAGKTTAVLNSGLKFPLTEHSGAAQASKAGTTNCDWWLTNEAVLIDTAGRYVSQDVNQQPDAAEWHGFLAVLRKYRSRAPINGAILTIDAQELLDPIAANRERLAIDLRARLAELRSELGIRFPVYVTITKMDLLEGFNEYFQSLTSEGRAQTWGFTLPYLDPSKPAPSGKNEAGDSPLLLQVRAELGALAERLDDGVNTRVQEEFDAGRRRLLYALPQEFEGLSKMLAQMIGAIFLDSRFDATELHHNLRGVYFTSAAQSEDVIPGNRLTLMERVYVALGLRQAPSASQDVSPSNENSPNRTQLIGTALSGNRSYFLSDLFTRLIVPEAHLVRPNLRWEFRFRVLRLIGHAVSIVLFLALASALSLSFANNEQYLKSVTEKKDMLKTLVTNLFAQSGEERLKHVPDALTTAQDMPLHRGLDVSDPAMSYRYGLYTGSTILAAADTTYNRLEDTLLLPQIVHRMEVVLRAAIDAKDAKTAYNTLRVYLLINDKNHYNATDVKTWVLQDWEASDSASVFGGRASMIGHINHLFSEERVVQSSFVKNEALVQDARNFLNADTSTQRLYERAKQAMASESPEDFTLTRAVGPQAGTVFTRFSGKPLDKGIPGLLTYDGYFKLFDKRLPEFVKLAKQDDAWVMGNYVSTQKKTLDDVANALGDDGLTEDIRRQYLTEYANQWNDFLEDIRTVTGSNLTFDLTVLRAFASPDSPLSRLARAAARETSLSKPLIAKSNEDKGFFDKATDKLDQQASKVSKSLNVRPQERMERELVDSRFAALREVVTGQADDSAAPAAGGGKPGLENIAGLLNEYYTVLVVADTALGTNSLPPGAADAGMKLKLEAGKLPAPFKAVLTALADSGTDKVAQGASAILSTQAQTQLDRIVGALKYQVSDPCKQSIEGRYPFSDSTQEVSIEDFTRIFAAGGAADDFFQKQLLPFVDTSSRPWRYKNPETANQMASSDALASSAASGVPATGVGAASGPTLMGELLKLLAKQGPNPDAFARMNTIRDVFFREPGSKKMAWKMDIKATDVDPTITELIIDIDGQTQRYSHGPVQTLAVTWPGPRGGANAELTATPRISAATSSIITSGPWALMRLIERAKLVNTATAGRVIANFSLDGRKAVLDINTGSSLASPLTTDLLKSFQCPGAR
ncbi:type VI secretion system membrane subunit TssM [Collimonas sp. NPDC087041]|uniref:type VI secretion system membrane subunit TssM n=1 Tax=Collimonas sp. NPDC087041 TaxID=3363960 RepID=UPI00382B93E9